jgi:hypothetical protein
MRPSGLLWLPFAATVCAGGPASVHRFDLETAGSPVTAGYPMFRVARRKSLWRKGRILD